MLKYRTRAYNMYAPTKQATATRAATVVTKNTVSFGKASEADGAKYAIPGLSMLITTTLAVMIDTNNITAAPLSTRLTPRKRKSSADAGTRRNRLRMGWGKGSLPVRAENSPSATLTRLSIAATEMSDKVIACIPGSLNDMTTAYPEASRPSDKV